MGRASAGPSESSAVRSALAVALGVGSVVALVADLLADRSGEALVAVPLEVGGVEPELLQAAELDDALELSSPMSSNSSPSKAQPLRQHILSSTFRCLAKLLPFNRTRHR